MDGTIFKTDFGWAAVAATEKGVCEVVLPTQSKTLVRKMVSDASLSSTPLLSALERDIVRYFKGGRVSFKDYRLDYKDATEFQKLVWKAASRIPYGETATYGDVARAVGKPSSCRAVGQALGANPIPLLIPCHRVVAASGVGGFSGGTDLKAKMLQLEGTLR